MTISFWHPGRSTRGSHAGTDISGPGRLIVTPTSVSRQLSATLHAVTAWSTSASVAEHLLEQRQHARDGQASPSANLRVVSRPCRSKLTTQPRCHVPSAEQARAYWLGADADPELSLATVGQWLEMRPATWPSAEVV